MLSTEHVAALGFDNVHTARNRLHLLTSRGVLTRFRDCVRPGSQSWRWMLGPVGAAFIAARDGTPTPGAGTLAAKTNRLSASPRLGHLLGVNGFFVDLAAHARHNRGAALSLWWSERTCGTVTGNLVHPDGHGVWVQDGRTVSFWLEYDNATEPTWRVLDKPTGYARLHRAADLDHTVLIRMQTHRQEHTLRARLGDHPGVTGGLRVATASGTGIHPAGGCGSGRGHHPPTPGRPSHHRRPPRRISGGDKHKKGGNRVMRTRIATDHYEPFPGGEWYESPTIMSSASGMMNANKHTPNRQRQTASESRAITVTVIRPVGR